MSRSLVVVESPTKVKTISKFLGKDYDVTSCMGHIRDLPQKELGVDIEKGFKPKYQTLPGKQKVIKDLKSRGDAVDTVFLATDADREGEAIAWHVAQVMKLSEEKTRRISFHEITRDAIVKSLQSPGTIDMRKVDAQQARRVLDRLVGYQVSPLLWRTVRKGLSAGRVQSVALRLICEREEEIEAFKPEEYWKVLVLLDNTSLSFEADLWKVDGKKAKIGDEEQATAIVTELGEQQFTVTDITKKRQKRRPAPPFITSTLQQEASRKLNMPPQFAMRVAQQLYEGVEVDGESVGLITYMRTDSTTIANEAVSSVRDHILQRYGKDYLPSRPVAYKNRSSAQEAHEAIRPTSMTRPPESIEDYLSPEQLRLYRLIWRRFVACQMKPQELDVTTVTIDGGRFSLRSSASVEAFDGYTRVYSEGRDEEPEEEEHPIPRALLDAWDTKTAPESQKMLDGYKTTEIKPTQHFTKPPARYTEATIVKEMEARGIGRPSTYANIIGTIIDRNYVEKKEKRLLPTELGRIVKKILVEQFPQLFNTEFTAEMEEELDKIEQGDDHWKDMLSEFYGDFQKTLESAMERRAEIKEAAIEKTDKVCTECGQPMVVRFGPRGKFYGCSGYPQCKNTEPFETEEMQEPVPFPGVNCPVCDSGMVRRQGPYGEFLACEHYPECKGTRPIPTGVACPKPDCPGQLVIKTSRRGKKFYGCDQYPECDVVYWDLPVPLEEPDPESGLMFKLEKTTREGTRLISAQYPPPVSRRKKKTDDADAKKKTTKKKTTAKKTTKKKTTTKRKTTKKSPETESEG